MSSKFAEVLRVAEEEMGIEIPKPKGPTVIDAIKKLAEVCDRATSKDGQGFSKFDREEHEDLIEKAISESYLSPKEEKTAYRFLKKYKKQLKGLGLEYNAIGHIARDEEPELEKMSRETIPEDVAQEAMRIAEQGDPLGYMLDAFNQSHIGDRELAESQFIGFGLQSALNTKGVFETWGGPSGKGKSDAARACIRQLPSEYILAGSITAKSLYHHAEELLDAGVLYLDDKNIEAGSDLEETLKRIQTEFQEGAYHEWLDGQRELKKAYLPKRFLVVRTYVDNTDTDGQLLNRSQNLSVDSSSETDKAVYSLVMELAEDGQTTDRVTREILICRALWRDIKSQVYRVKMPAISKLVEFSAFANRRNPSLFTDMVVGLACIRHKQRESEPGENGETILYAAFKDYEDAARIFNSQKDFLSSRLDPAEKDAVLAIKGTGEVGASIKDVFKILASKFPNDGWNEQKTRRLLFGRKDREGSGLVGKVPGLEVDDVPEWSHHGGRPVKRLKLGDDFNTLDLFGLNVKVYTPEEKSLSESNYPQLSYIFPNKG